MFCMPVKMADLLDLRDNRTTHSGTRANAEHNLCKGVAQRQVSAAAAVTARHLRQHSTSLARGADGERRSRCRSEAQGPQTVLGRPNHAASTNLCLKAPVFYLRASLADLETCNPARTTAGKTPWTIKIPKTQTQLRELVKNLAKPACGPDPQTEPNSPPPLKPGEKPKSGQATPKTDHAGKVRQPNTQTAETGGQPAAETHPNGKRQSEKATAGEPRQRAKTAKSKRRARLAGNLRRPKNPKAQN